MEAWHHVSTLVCTVATGDKITGDVKTLDKSEDIVTVPEDSLCSQCSPACLYLCLCFLCVCVLAWASSPFSWLCSSCTPVWNRLITSPTLLTCLSSVHQLAVYLPLLFTHSWPDCCFNHSGSYDSRPIYFLFLVIQFLCVLHVNLFLLCPRIITCLPVLLLVCLPVNNYQVSNISLLATLHLIQSCSRRHTPPLPWFNPAVAGSPLPAISLSPDLSLQ